MSFSLAIHPFLHRPHPPRPRCVCCFPSHLHDFPSSVTLSVSELVHSVLALPLEGSLPSQWVPHWLSAFSRPHSPSIRHPHWLCSLWSSHCGRSHIASWATSSLPIGSSILSPPLQREVHAHKTPHWPAAAIIVIPPLRQLGAAPHWLFAVSSFHPTAYATHRSLTFWASPFTPCCLHRL